MATLQSRFAKSYSHQSVGASSVVLPIFPDSEEFWRHRTPLQGRCTYIDLTFACISWLHNDAYFVLSHLLQTKSSCISLVTAPDYLGVLAKSSFNIDCSRVRASLHRCKAMDHAFSQLHSCNSLCSDAFLRLKSACATFGYNFGCSRQ